MRLPTSSFEPGECTSGVFRLKEEDELVAEMAFAVHDAKNMACALQAGLDWLKAAHSAGTDLEVGAAMEEMGQVVSHLSRILMTALESARAGGRMQITFERVGLDELVRASLARCRHRADIAGVRLVARACDQVACEADRELLQRALDNLLDNALKVSEPESTIVVEVGRHGDRAVVSVSDDGPGIPLEDQSRIFDLFVTGTPRGTGVGLAFCQRVAEAHGGRLAVFSGPGRGATFVLSIPAGP